MTDALSLKCLCGAFTGTAELRPKEPRNRLVCYCDDCRSFANHLGQAERVLDDQGGSDILQISPACLKVTSGRDHLAVLRLSSKGIYRWYSSCCNTPIGNTPPNSKMPYLGLITSIVESDDKARSLDQQIGPVKFGVGAGSRHPIKAAWPVSKGFGFSGFTTALTNMARWRLKGDHKRSELFDVNTGEPVVIPNVLSLEERNAARSV